MRHTLCLLLAGCLWSMVACAPGRAQDTDRDGIPDAVEEQLGTDKETAESLETVGTYPAQRADQPDLDIVRVDFGNVAQNRWLWAIHFAQPYTFENSQLIVYLDADHDERTGRQGMGCEVMLAHRLGIAGVTGFAPDGSSSPAPLPRVALVDGVLYLCHDGALRQADGHSVFRFNVLSETVEPHVAVDSEGGTEVRGCADSDRRKVITLDDITEDENFRRTEGLDLIWQLQADPANVVMSSVGAELVNMAYYDAEYRWPAVHGANGSISLTVPRAGTFQPAVVVYDTSGSETYELQVDGRRVGRFVAAEDDRRQRIHFLSQPLEFRGGERLTIRTGRTGNHITEDILLLAQQPPERGRKFELSQVEAAWLHRGDEQLLRLTWITTWPSACTVEYGTRETYGQQVTEPEPRANHRVYLSGLQPGAWVHYRIVAPRPGGPAVVGPALTFHCRPPDPAAGTAEESRLELHVANPYGFRLVAQPITSGVPFHQGELADAANARLLDPSGQEVPLQADAGTHWPDGSIKWLFVSFLTDAEPHAMVSHTLEYGTAVRRSAPAGALTCRAEGDTLSVDTGALQVAFDKTRSGFPTSIRSARAPAGQPPLVGPRMAAEVTDCQGNQFTTLHPPERIELEEAGPVRAVVLVAGHHRGPDGQTLFAYRNRFVFYAGLSRMALSYTWLNDVDASHFAEFDAIRLHVPVPAGEAQAWTAGLGDGQQAQGHGSWSLTQLRDDAYQVTPAAPEGTTARRADGWLDLAGPGGGLTAVVRDFWQLYPKALHVTGDGLTIDLCPDFAPGTYDDCTKLDEIKLYYYLMGGKYKVACGLQKQHELLLSFRAGDDPVRAAEVAQVFQEPLLATCTPQRYCETRVFGEVLPATAGRSPEYEAVCENVYRSYVDKRERSREYGMLNFGDQWGERQVNWANGEYDHHHAALLQYIRTGDRRWYFLGEKAARHAIDIDTCHHGPRCGGEWIHAMGHTGGYFTEPFEGEGIPYGGMSVCHTWTEGFFDWYALSGDRTGAENAALVADYYDGAYLNNYDWDNCRTNGWHLLLTIAAYRATHDPYYLNAARVIVARTLERQSPDGGWHRQMVPGHCHDMPRHRGEANFMLGVLGNGLEEHYREVPDPRVAEAIVGGARQAVRELWVDASNGFRYTSCPNMTGYTANNDMTSEILFFAHRLTGESTFAEIGMRAMRAQFADGLGSIAHLRWTPHLIYNMDQISRVETPAP